MQLNRENMPKHIGVIMDGNGRWAKSKGLKRTMGHKQGVENLRTIVKECKRLEIPFLTVYAFSTENWKRTQEEVSSLMWLLEQYMTRELKELHKEGVRIKTIGDINELPESTCKKLTEGIEYTKDNRDLTLTLALNYGSRSDITQATKLIADKVKNGEILLEEINEETISNHLSTNFMPDPDLIIRPSGEYRLSNFMMWESSYSELWFSNINWPDFGADQLQQAISDYQNRDRRFGNAK
ncbi:isoprenyl transferase [Proteocatella sphenisci]|uniref:isoprenyl transferase n=1 Tax=Proteocatella sphenisci TaxID=181070 RepID=UPI0004B486C0|nr:isoprenyl transferase [Proteocatella sphenisci]